MTRTILFVPVLLGALSTSAWAQFAGDVFFEEPSIEVTQGETATMRIQMFSGDIPLGGAHFNLQFDAADLAIEEVRAGGTAAFQDALVTAPAGPGRIGVVTLNGASLDGPFGTVDLVEIVVRPLAPAGTLLEIHIGVDALVDTGSAPLPEANGLSARITVTAPGAMLQQRVTRAPSPADVARALRLRRPGHRVVLRRGSFVGTVFVVESVVVDLFDPRALRD